MSSQAPQHEGQVQRFHLALDVDTGDPEMDPALNGSWVRYDDHKAAYEEQKARVERAEEEVERVRRHEAETAQAAVDWAKKLEARAEQHLGDHLPEGDRE